MAIAKKKRECGAGGRGLWLVVFSVGFVVCWLLLRVLFMDVYVQCVRSSWYVFRVVLFVRFGLAVFVSVGLCAFLSDLFFCFSGATLITANRKFKKNTIGDKLLNACIYTKM